jgi:hypothetical protein
VVFTARFHRFGVFHSLPLMFPAIEAGSAYLYTYLIRDLSGFSALYFNPNSALLVFYLV